MLHHVTMKIRETLMSTYKNKCWVSQGRVAGIMVWFRAGLKKASSFVCFNLICLEVICVPTDVTQIFIVDHGRKI